MRLTVIITFLIFFLNIPSPAFATGISGKIVSISPSEELGWTEVRVQTSRGEQTFFIHQETLIAGIVPARKLKKGANIFVPRPASSAANASGTGRGGFETRPYKGFKSPFGGIPKSLRKKMNLPDIPGVPEIPSAKTNLPQIPKTEIPKIPQVPQGGARHASPLHNEEPSEEEKSLFGRVDSNQPLLPGTREESSEIEKKEVMRVDNTKDGIRLQLKNSEGRTEEQMFSPDNPVLEQLRISDLKLQMSVDLEVREDQAVAKVTVVG